MVYITLNTLSLNGIPTVSEKVFNAETILPSLKPVVEGTKFEYGEYVNKILQINTWVVSQTVEQIILLIQTFNTQALITNIDNTTPDVFYIGNAAIGASEASPVWRIKKIEGTTYTTIKWASGTTGFVNIWNDRASLIYS